MTANNCDPGVLISTRAIAAGGAAAAIATVAASASVGSSFAGLIRRLQVIRFPLVVSVIFHHQGMGTVHLADGVKVSAGPLGLWAETIQGFLSYGLGGIRMPTFFLISGYLFFLGFGRSRDWLAKKLLSRTRSVLVPLLVWNLIVLLLLLIAQNLTVTSVFFSGKSPWSNSIRDFGLLDFLNALIGVKGDPILYPLWFLRDLFLMCLLAPLYFVLPRLIQLSLVLVLGGLWLFDAWPYGVPTVEACFFFSLGGLVALSRRDLFLLDPYLKWACAVLAVLVTAGFFVPADEGISTVLTHLKHLTGVVMVLSISRHLVLMPRTSAMLVALSAPSFFLFVAHEPLLTIVRKTMYMSFVPDSSGAALLIYFAAVASTVLLLLGIYYFAERFAPRTLSALTGGRSAA